MEKIILIVIFFFSITSCNDDSTKVIAQDNIWQNTDKIKVDIDSVIDFTSDGEYFYFLTLDSIIKVNGYGNVISSYKHENVTGIYYDKNKERLLKILKNCIILFSKEDTLKINIKDFKESKNFETKHLGFNGEKYLTCLYPYGIGTFNWSNRIITVDEYGLLEKFNYFSGIASGFYCYNNLIYFIGNSMIKDDEDHNKPYTVGHLYIYDLKTKELINKPEKNKIPVITPIGIYIDDVESFYSYSNYDKTIRKYKE